MCGVGLSEAGKSPQQAALIARDATVDYNLRGLYSNYIFPKMLAMCTRHNAFDARRAEVLKSVSGKILEIGIGPGRNLTLYPESVREISAVDPNPGMERELKVNLKNQRIKVDFFPGFA